MHPTLTPDQVSQLVTAAAGMIVAGALVYVVRLVFEVRDIVESMRRELAAHYADDRAVEKRVSFLEAATR